jgi:hypothetical protein
MSMPMSISGKPWHGSNVYGATWSVSIHGPLPLLQ